MNCFYKCSDSIRHDMQLSRFIQALILMLMVALAASCTTGKEYTARIFAPRTVAKDSAVAAAPRFLNLDGDDSDSTGFVSTELYQAKDSNTAIVMRQATVSKTDSTQKVESSQPEAGVRIVKTAEVRNKRKRE